MEKSLYPKLYSKKAIMPIMRIAISCILFCITADSFGQSNNTITSPTNTATICQTASENGLATFTAPAGTVFTTVDFASYGTPNGSCGAFTVGSCNGANSQSVVEGLLLGKTGTIKINANNATFTDPCVSVGKRLYVQATYNEPICYNTSPGTISGSNPTGAPMWGGYNYSWQQSTSGAAAGFTTIAGATSKNYTPGNLTQTTWFRRLVTATDLWGNPVGSSYSSSIQIYVSPAISVTATSTPTTCVGGSAGTVTVSASGGTSPYTFSINGTTYQASNTFAGLPAGSQTVYAKGSDGCSNSTSVTVANLPASTDDQTTAGTNTWIGHAFEGMAFNSYVGYFSEAETFDEGFGGNTNCFPVSSSNGSSSIYTETFSVSFKMNSTRHGLYIADMGSDDGSRLYVDGTLVYNAWIDQSYTIAPRVLMSLTGSSALQYDYYENGTNNEVSFKNFTSVLGNNLTTGTNQSICLGNAGTSISGDAYGALPSGITLSGTGYQWTYSTTPGGARTNLAGATGATYTPNSSTAPFNTAGTYYIYRNAKIKSTNNLGVANYTATNESNAATIVVSPLTVGGTVSSSATVCSGSNSGTLNLSGQTGSVIRWESSTNGGGTWSTIANTTTSQAYNNITQTTLYRAVVQSGACASATSSTVTITVSPVSVGGSVAGSTTVCSGTNSGSLTLSGQTGSIVRWESSVNGGTSWTTIVNTTGSQNYTNITQTTMYRAVVQSGPCATANSAAATVTVNPVSVGGTVSSNATVCSGTNSGTLNLSGQTGSVVRWEYSINGGGSWTTIANTGTSQAYTNLTQTTLYRAVVQSSPCTTANSTSATITVNPVSVGGTVSASAAVCSGTNGATLSLSGQTGNVVRWESSVDGGSTWSPIVNTTTSQAYSNLTQTTLYRAVVQSGVCATATSSVATITVTPVPSATISYDGSPYCSGTGTASVTFAGTSGGTFSSTAGLNINAATGDINLNTSTANSYTVTYKIAAAGGCAQFTTTAPVTITPKVSGLAFTLGATSTRCQGAGSVTYTATASNTTGITYSLDAASIAAGNTINAATGIVTYDPAWSGTSVITAVAAGCIPLTTTHTATVSATPSVSATSTYTCVGGSSANITATGSVGLAPFTYNINAGGYQASNLFTGRAAGTYTIGVKSAAGCTASTTITVNPYPNSADDQTTAGTDSWIGHAYSGKSFQNYIGYFTEAETFNELFGGNTTCLPLTADYGPSSLYTEQFSVRYNMNSTKKGLYVVDLGSDDGSRLYVDGTLVYNNWVDQGFVTKPRNLINLTGSSALSYEYYENTGGNSVIFQNLTLVLANSLSTNNTQSICVGSAGVAISGDTYGALPAGISLSGTGYQWSYSLTPAGARTNIAGATGATFTPNTSTAPFNTAGTYYVYRNAKLSSANNVGITPYVATNESNAAVITVIPAPTATIAYATSPFCSTSGIAESVTVTGSTGGTFSGTGLVVNAASGSIIPNQNAAGNYTVTYTIPAVTGCASFSTTTGIVIYAPGTWIGKTDGDWNNPTNWICGVIPTTSINAVIPQSSPVFPMVSISNAEAKDLNISAGASVTITGSIKVAGSINNSGSLDLTNGTLEMAGSASQAIAGSMFINKTVNNLIDNNTGSGLSVSSTPNDTLKITNLLSFGNASAVLNTGDNITLVSNSAGTASVGVVGNSNMINGKATVERYINTGTGAGQHPKSWQFLATPTNGQTIKQSWMENGLPVNYYGTMISGQAGTAAGFDLSSPAPSMKYFDDATGNWIGVSNTGNQIADPRGYMVFVRGDRTVTSATQAANPTVLRTKGTLNFGTQAAINVALDKFQSVGNPYASAIDFTLISRDAAIDNKFYVYDTYLAGTYGVGGYQTLSAVNNWKPVPGGTAAYPSAIGNSVIQSGQAFFVHSTSANSTGSSTLTLMENAKTTNAHTNFARMAGVNPNRQFLRASLMTSTGTMADGNVVAFDRTFSDAVDGDDAVKMLNSGENFTVKTDNKLLIVEAKAPLNSGDTINYYTNNLKKSAYTLVFAPENLQQSGLQAYLIDKYLAKETPISLADSSFVNVSVDNNAGSSASDRFKVVFRQMNVLPVTITSVTATLHDADALVKWNVENESGIQQYQIERSGDGTHFSQISSVSSKNNARGNYSFTDYDLADGTWFYRIRVVSIDGKGTYTSIVKVTKGKAAQEITVFPNPIRDNVVRMQFKNEPAGIYGVRLLNAAGQTIVSKKISHAEGTMEETLDAPALAKGVYQLEIIKIDGSVRVIKVLN